jgi:LysM repeat protein
MNRTLILTGIMFGILQPQWHHAADSSLQALAARQELEDFVRSTNTRLRDLEDALLSQQKRISSLEDENRRLKAEIAQAANNANTSGLESSLKRLADDIQEVDKRRLADNKLTLEKLSRLADSLTKSASRPPPAPEPAQPVIPNNADVFKYEIQSGDNLYRIVPKLKAQGVNVTVEDIQKANPRVDWTRLKIGQPILIPVTGN